MKTILVTGDIVRDAHLYGGAKSDATSITDLGTVFEEKTGGAALTAELLVISGDALGKAWDKTDADWKKGNENRAKAKKEPLPRPEQHSEVRPASYFSCHPALSAPDFATKPPLNLCSYGVWTPHPAKKDTKDLVWRTDVGSHFGYGPAENRQSGFCYTPNKSNIAHPVGVTVIDDGGTLFRHEVCRGIWPDLSKDGGGLYVLKMSHPLCCGDLWPALKPILPRLTVIVSAADLRRADAQINARLSWERCVEDTIATLNRMPAARELLHAANLIVNFGSGGALWVSGAEPRTYRLFFDGERFGGDFSSQFEGTVYGFQSCLTAGIAHHLMLHQLALEEPSPKPGEKPSLLASHKEFAKAMYAGIAAGLNARRKLLILGHGPVNNKIPPGFPFYELGQVIANESTGYASVQISPDRFNASAASWTILAQSETVSDANDKTPLYGLAALTARYGPAETLSDVPALHKGNLFTVDRSEIESLRTIDAIITAYEKKKIQKKPLSIGVFGPPGAGKSFAVKILALAILGPKSPFIEFNLSQFKGPDELIGAFHRIRDEVLKGVTPVAFWDEFDSQKYKWLQYLLAPMQDGTFQEGQITHPIGKCIFIFAGGTSPCLEQFGVAEPVEPGEAELSEMKPEIREFRLRKFLEQRERFLDFKLLKGPDFVSRLHGFLNVLGPNPRDENDITWPVRRALLLRGILQLPDSKELSIDPGLLSALIGVPKYWHGARSFEKILDALVQGRIEGRLTRSALPPARTGGFIA